jgi:hypothetical protein
MATSTGSIAGSALRRAGDVVLVARVLLSARELADPARRARLRTADGTASPVAALAAVRALGQSVLILGAGRRPRRTAAAVDLLHAASMLAFAAVRPGRGGVDEAVSAGTFALLGAVLS